MVEKGLFSSVILDRFIMWHIREVSRLMFESMTQGGLSLTKYEAYFYELSRHAMTIVLDEAYHLRSCLLRLQF